MGLTDIEWYEVPNTDEEIIKAAKRLIQSGAAPPVKQRHVRRSASWGVVKHTLWFLALPYAALHALVFGLLGALICITIIGAPLGMLLMVFAGLPGAALIGLRMDKKLEEVKYK